MGRQCIIQTCKNTETLKKKGLIDGVIFHNFPTNEKRCNEWKRHIRTLANQMGPISSSAKICSDHFSVSMYNVKPNGTKVLSNEAYPTVFGDNIKDRLEIEYLEVECLDLDEAKAKTNSDLIDVKLPTGDIACKEEICIDDFVVTVYTDQPAVQPNCEKEQLKEADSTLHLNEGGSHMEIQCPIDSLSCKRRTSTEEKFLSNERLKANDNLQVPVTHASRKYQRVERVSMTNCIILKPGRIRYPGDINVAEMSSRREMSDAISFCQQKIKDQAKQISALKRKLRAKDNQIEKLRRKKKFLLSPHAAGSIELRTMFCD